MKISVCGAVEKAKVHHGAWGLWKDGEHKLLRRVAQKEEHRFLEHIWKKNRLDGKEGSLFFSYVPGPADRSVFVCGLGGKKNTTLQKFRKLGAALFNRANRERIDALGIELASISEGSGFSEAEVAAALVEGIRLKAYRFDKYKTKAKKEEKKDALKEIVLIAGDRKQLAKVEKEIVFTEEVLEATNAIRLIADEPGGSLTPVRFAEEARKLARAAGLHCKILNKQEIKRLKMGGLLGVAKGSKEEPRFIILEHRGATSKPLVFVGKGITFDSGGISIKPAAQMDLMRYDMCGGAAVLGALVALARLKVKEHVIGLIPTCENLPSDDPQRPGDILTTMTGKTVEVLNTDAEGRLILSDALAYAQKYKPRAIVDLATLTGACVATFGDVAIGLMGNNAALLKSVQKAGEVTGERCWELPMWPEYGEMIKSDFADLKNIGGRYAGTITAGKFLEEFAGDYPWAHLDIAGVAWRETPNYFAKSGATGVGVRLLVQYVRDLKTRK